MIDHTKTFIAPGSVWRIIPDDFPPVLYGGGDMYDSQSPVDHVRGERGEVLLVLARDETITESWSCHYVYSTLHGVRRCYASWFDGLSLMRLDAKGATD